MARTMTRPASTSPRVATPRLDQTRATALTPTPRSTANPSARGGGGGGGRAGGGRAGRGPGGGTARPVLRSASPKLDDSANDLNKPPSALGSAYGCAPTATTTPIRTRSTK